MNSGSPPPRRRPARRRGNGPRENSSPPRVISVAVGASATARRSEPSAFLPSSQWRGRSCGKRWRSRVESADELRHVVVACRASTSPPSRSRRPGNRRCCCRPGCCRPRRRRASAARLARETARRADCGAAAGAAARIVGIVGRALDAAIEAVVVVGAVAVVLAVGLVVLVLVADESASVKPSWTVTWLMLARGPRPSCRNCSAEPVMRAAPCRRSCCLRRASTAAASLR